MKHERVDNVAVIIKTFTTPGGRYVYDRETNSLLSVNQEEFAACEQVEAGTATDNDWLQLKRFTDQGYFKESKLKEILHPATKFLPFQLKNDMAKITMQVTQDCNLRCSYCAYSGGYSNQRLHNKKTMPLETMKKCVDFIMARSKNVPEVSIGFYGGEPLLELENIKACISYIKTKYGKRKIRYSITTNGTFLGDDAIIQFLQETDINLMISIDGPREVHDINRVYDNGKGSFDDIMKNVEYIRQNYPEYFNKIMFATVVAPGTDLACVDDFYSAGDVFTKNTVLYNNVSTFGIAEDIKYDDLLFITDTYQRAKCLLSALGLYSPEKTSKLFGNGLANIKTFYDRLSKSGISEVAHPSGPCLPGVMRPFVDTDGRIFPCERVTESNAMQIGHIDTGIDIDKAIAVLNVGKLTEAECFECWNFMNCTLCVSACNAGENLCGEERLQHCDASLNGAMDLLFGVCLLNENNRDISNLWGNADFHKSIRL